jgi:PAS domain-containing protein
LDWLLALGLIFLALVAAILGLLVVSAFKGPPKRPSQSVFAEGTQATIFLFDGERLVDSTAGARLILSSSRGRGSNWLKLLGYLTLYFPDAETQLQRLCETGQIVLDGRSSKGKRVVMTAEDVGGMTRITLVDPALEGKAFGTDPIAFRALTGELEMLRDTLGQAPVLVWRENQAGEVIWANTAYLDLAAHLQQQGKELCWPLPRLFEKVASQQTVAGQRAKISLSRSEILWFDLMGAASLGDRVVFALPADGTVRAEQALNEFMQTLAKTFAELPIGLAIFDRQRQLQLFNPALLDLTGLPPDFLTLRPSLLAVLDALRDRNVLPEPKDYRSWRRQLIEMEKAAASGLYEETWNLPDGQTFKVTGRPHPNGALALMIEDITNEVSRTRRYRSDLELGQSVIDEMQEAVAVFSPSGQMVMSNRAYDGLWAQDPDQRLGEGSIRQVSRQWRAQSAPSNLWYDVEEFITTVGNRVPWQEEARLLDGRRLHCRFVPLSGGSTLAAFRAIDPAESTKPALAETAIALKSA